MTIYTQMYICMRLIIYIPELFKDKIPIPPIKELYQLFPEIKIKW